MENFLCDTENKALAELFRKRQTGGFGAEMNEFMGMLGTHCPLDT